MDEHKIVNEAPIFEDVLQAYHTVQNFRGHPLEFFVCVLAAWDSKSITASPDDVAVATNLVTRYCNGDEDCVTCKDPLCQVRQAFGILDKYVEMIMLQNN